MSLPTPEQIFTVKKDFNILNIKTGITTEYKIGQTIHGTILGSHFYFYLSDKIIELVL